MLIPVVHMNGSYDRVSPVALDRLLAQQDVLKFRRQSGWVVVGQQKLRGMGSGWYEGPERRAGR